MATSIPHTRLRRRIAEHMVRSKATSPHVYTSVEVDFEELVRLRARVGLSHLPFVCAAMAGAITEWPRVNASWTDEELVVHPNVNIAVAVDLDFEGLVAPVVRDVETKDVPTIAREVRDLARRARTNALVVDDMTGGTVTITNMSGYGTEMTLPIINQPQVAIIAFDGVRRRPAVISAPDGSESIQPRSLAKLILAWDHRAFDGAYAASFLTRVRDLLETEKWGDRL